MYSEFSTYVAARITELNGDIAGTGSDLGLMTILAEDELSENYKNLSWILKLDTLQDREEEADRFTVNGIIEMSFEVVADDTAGYLTILDTYVYGLIKKIKLNPDYMNATETIKFEIGSGSLKAEGLNNFLENGTVLRPRIAFEARYIEVLTLPDVLGAVTLSTPANGATVTARDFTWATLSGASSYEILITNSSGTTVAEQDGITLTGYSVPSGVLTAGQTYTWKVRGYNSAGAGTWSDARSFTFSTNESETTALLARMTNQPDATRITYINDFILGLKTDGLWTLCDLLRVKASHSNAGSEALLNWIENDHNGTIQGDMTFTTDSGFTSNGSTGYIKSDFFPSTDGVNYTQNGASAGVYINATGTDGADLGINSRVEILSYFTGLFLGAINGLEWTFNTANVSPLGFWLMVRTGANAATLYHNGSAFATSTQASFALSSAEIYEHARNNVTTPVLFTTRRQALVWIGGSLTAVQAAKLNGRVQTYLGLLGASA